MVKTRMGVLDLKVQARELKRLVGARVANVYDVNSRTYVLKLSVPPKRKRRVDADEIPAERHALSSDLPTTSGTQESRDADLTLDMDRPADAASTGQEGTPGAAESQSTEESWQKTLLLIESGARIHTTQFDRDHGSVPSGFCLKLRKHIRTRRLDNVRQLGGDRVIALTFAAGRDIVAHLILEFYAGGNIVLTNSEYAVLVLLRVVRPRDGEAGNDSMQTPSRQTGKTTKAIAGDQGNEDPQSDRKENAGGMLLVGQRYPVENARDADPVSHESLAAGIRAAQARSPTQADIDACTSRANRRRLLASCEARKALAVMLEVGPQVLEHALVSAGLDARTSMLELSPNDTAPNGTFARILAALQDAEAMLSSTLTEHAPKGYVFIRTSSADTDGKASDAMEDFSPYLLAQHKDRRQKEFPTFDAAVDHYFAQIETDRAEAAQAKREAAAFKKVDKLTAELRGQVSALEAAQETTKQKAQAIESCLTEVDAAITVVRSALAAGVDWMDLARMVEDEKKNGNPVAEIIHSLHLDRNEVTLMLEDSWGVDDEADYDIAAAQDEEHSDGVGGEDPDDGNPDDNEEDERRAHDQLRTSSLTKKALLVDVNLAMSAHANAREYYAMKKVAAGKMEKAVVATDRTIKAASKKASNDAKKMEADATATSLRARRKPLWFEKFHWMVSSENYLIVAGRDAQQNEQIVKRYMGPADAYVHADLHGAASVVVKNQKHPGARGYVDIPQMTLEQAGSFAMCRSTAWDSKIVTSAWWVHANQVSKTAPTGLSLATGSFVIRGKKNFLDPSQLVMGFAFLFKVDDSCVVRHKGERKVRTDAASSTLVDRHSNAKKGPGAADLPEDDHEDDAEEVDVVGGDYEPTDSLPARETTVVSENQRTSQTLSASETTVESRPETTPQNAVPSDSVDATEKTSDAALFARFAGGPHEIGGSAVGRDNPATDESANTNKGDNQTQRTTKRRMSAKERRQMKNAARSTGPEGAPSEVTPSESDVNESNESESSKGPGKPADGPAPAKQAVVPRGKRSKLRKMKKKYGDQDEVEREIALTVLGAKKVKGFDDETRNAQTDRAESPPDVDSAGQSAGNDGPERDEDGENEKNNTQRASGGRYARQEKKEVLRLMEEEGIQELTELERESLTILDTLTAVPFEDDVIQFALPVCAPYNALNGYRYRAKLLPGAMKRGKAYRASLALFTQTADREGRRLERDAMRLVVEGDAIQMMLGNVRVMAPGLADAQKSLAVKAKKSAKAKKR